MCKTPFASAAPGLKLHAIVPRNRERSIYKNGTSMADPSAPGGSAIGSVRTVLIALKHLRAAISDNVVYLPLSRS